jgi:hypothetical protein
MAKKTEILIANPKSNPFSIAIHNVGNLGLMKFFRALVLKNVTNVL